MRHFTNVDVLSHYIQLEILAFMRFGCLGRYEDYLEFRVYFKTGH